MLFEKPIGQARQEYMLDLRSLLRSELLQILLQVRFCEHTICFEAFIQLRDRCLLNNHALPYFFCQFSGRSNMAGGLDIPQQAGKPLDQGIVLTTVYNCAQIKLTDPRDGCKLWEMLLSIPTGDGHDQEQDSEYDTRIISTREVHSRHCDQPGHRQKYSAQVFAPSRAVCHAPSTTQSSFQA